MGPLPAVSEEEEDSSTTDSPPRFSDMEKVAREAAKAAQGDTEVPLKFHPLLEDFPFSKTSHKKEGRKDDWEGPSVPELERLVPRRSGNESSRGSYDLWTDLNHIKADITIAQLLELSPEIRKLLKTKLPI
jgi:hypothetical protein